MRGDDSDAVRTRGSLPDFHNSPGPLFRRGRQVHDALWLRYVGAQVRPLQYAVLTALELEPGLDQQTLGERIALDKSTVGEMIGRLGKRGLIRTSEDPADARRKLLHITDEGRDLLYEIAPLAEQIGRDMFAPLTADERKQLIRLLDKMVYRLEARMGNGRNDKSGAPGSASGGEEGSDGRPAVRRAPIRKGSEADPPRR